MVNGYFGIYMELIEMERLSDHQTIASKYAIVQYQKQPLLNHVIKVLTIGFVQDGYFGLVPFSNPSVPVRASKFQFKRLLSLKHQIVHDCYRT